ncbi:HAD family hydrolase [Streptomyces pinistramenti]|uniref:HAD family hydrolase n=1 Tax=Streptomyces pinistramenti TaxID=2884812 RepID=UPI001D08BBB2|nr:HAD family hydrolase [Streptomyces pinistramenti]MCB5908106.1 HAD family hydrolase [Streptomyces pinistramenti]
MSGPLIAVWDFDGTLGHRRHGIWAECLLEILDVQQPDHTWTFPQIFDALARGFPWHEPCLPHPHLNAPDAWWDHVTQVVATALTGLGMDNEEAATAAHATRRTYTDRTAWSLYPQALDVLDTLTQAGWQHVLLTNHVPELPDILDSLSLTSRLRAVVNSAASGHEKPHPEAFRLARAAAPPGARLVMIGDNPDADIKGATRAGIDAIWVRRDEHTDVPDLASAGRLLLQPDPLPRQARQDIREVPPLPTTCPAANVIR